MKRSRRPSIWLRLFTPGIRILTDTLGLAPPGVMVLHVPQSGTGRDCAIVLNPLVYQGAYHLVSRYEDSEWVRLLRQAGRATLKRGWATVPVVVAEEIAGEDRAPVLKAWHLRWGDRLGGDLGLGESSSDAEIAALAEGLPMFRLKLGLAAADPV